MFTSMNMFYFDIFKTSSRLRKAVESFGNDWRRALIIRKGVVRASLFAKVLRHSRSIEAIPPTIYPSGHNNTIADILQHNVASVSSVEIPFVQVVLGTSSLKYEICSCPGCTQLKLL